MFSKGYTSCIACHVDVRGGGLFTEYGKLISTSQTYMKNDSYKEGAFKKSIRYNSKLDHALQLRYAYLKSELSNESFPMQADYLFNANIKKVSIAANLARAPKRSKESDNISTIDLLYFKDLKARISLNDNHRLVIGRQKQYFLLNTLDHTAYNKSLNRFNVTDLASVVEHIYIGEDKLVFTSIFGPSFGENDTSKEYGIKSEYRHSLGAYQYGVSFLAGKTKSVDRIVFGLFQKFYVNNYYTSLESILTKRYLDGGTNFTQVTAKVKFGYLFSEYFNSFISFENYYREEPFRVSAKRAGLSINFRITRNLSIRADQRRTFLDESDEDLLIVQTFLNWW